MKRQQPTTAQLYGALSERADIWQQHDECQPVPACSSKDHAHITGTVGAAVPGSSSFPTSRKRHQLLLLLQHALFPLTRSCQPGDAGLRDDDLRPHASPKAKQLYDALVGPVSVVLPGSQAPQGARWTGSQCPPCLLLLCLQVTGVRQCPWYMLNPGQPTHAVLPERTNRLRLKTRAE